MAMRAPWTVDLTVASPIDASLQHVLSHEIIAATRRFARPLRSPRSASSA